jgi:O-antigen ligase
MPHDVRVPVRVLLAAGMLSLFIVPALGRFLGLGASVGGVFAALPFAALVYTQVILVNTGSVLVPRLTTSAIPLMVWIALLLFSMVRSNNPMHSGSAGLLLVLLWTGIVGSIALVSAEICRHPEDRRETILLAAALALPTFVVLNVLLYAIGVRNPQPLLVDHPEGSLGALLGLRVARTLLPFARGINNFGVLAGMGLCSSLCIVLASRTGIWLRLTCVAIALTCVGALVLVDSRGPLLFGVLAGVAVPVMYRLRLVRLGRWAVFISPILPALLLLALAALARTPVAQSVSRNPGDLSSATGRVLIWGVATNKLLQNPSPIDFIGYGQYGAKGAGISTAWARAFQGFEADPTLASTHNFTLQLIYDMGYFGLVTVLWLVWWAVGRLYRQHSAANEVSTTAFTGMLIYLVLAGTTEATISIIFSEPLIILTFILALLAFTDAYPSASESPTQSKADR